MENKIQNAVATVNAGAVNKQNKTLGDYVKSMEGEIAKALPEVITPERFSRMVLSALSANPELQKCTPKSFLGAMMSAAQVGLEPNSALGFCWLLPYANHGTLECQLQISYKGLIALAYRSGEVTTIQSHIVYANDKFNYELGLDPKLEHIPATENRGDPTFVYAVVRLKNGGYSFEVMSMADIKAHAKKYSKSYSSNYSPWNTAFEEMAKKTCLKKALKFAPMSTEFVRNASVDGSVKTEISEDMYSVPSEVVADVDTGEVIESEETV